MGDAAYRDTRAGAFGPVQPDLTGSVARQQRRSSHSRVHPDVATGVNGSGETRERVTVGLRAKMSRHPCRDQVAHCRPLDPASLSLLPETQRHEPLTTDCH
jgi:hypothetical protein